MFKKSSNFARIFLVRHGKVENPKKIVYGFLPLPLSAKGWSQSRQAGAVLKDKNISVIISSPHKRTLETAEIISQVISRGKVKIKTDKNLRESEFNHMFQGLTRRQATEKYPKEMKIYKRTPSKAKAGETLAKMAGRVIDAIERGIKKYPGKNIIFISSRDPIVTALLKISGRGLDDIHKVKGAFTPGSISEIWSVGKRLINKTYLAS